MTTFLVIVHVAVCFFLIGVVLLQSGKGADMGATFGSSGSSSQSLFGAGGGSTFLTKLTASVAFIFMVTSLSLAYLSGRPSSSSIMSDVKAVAPVQQAPAAPVVPQEKAPVAPAQK